jgi:hypothetical protein
MTRTLHFNCPFCSTEFRTEEHTYCKECKQLVKPVERLIEPDEPNLRPTIATLIAVCLVAFIVGVFYIYLRNP